MCGAASLRMAIGGADDSITLTIVVTNDSAASIVVTSLQPLVLDLPTMPSGIEGFGSGWGLEFGPTAHDPQQPHTIEVTAGRSAQGASPLVRLLGPDGSCLVVTPHVSGNWRIETVPVAGRLLVTAGLPSGQAMVLAPGESASTPAVTIGWGSSTVSAGRAVARAALDRAPAGPPLLTEWNHWWPYEDRDINEDVFLENAAIAARLGLEVAVLDAGWFGDAAEDSDWVQQRGDWHKVNTARFPHGLPWLADQTRRLGIEFGMWVEPEAVGGSAELAVLHPEFLATSSTVDGASPVYVCLGSPPARDYIRTDGGAVDRRHRCPMDQVGLQPRPGSGCDRDDHGHGPGDGLMAHYAGLYRIFDELRATYPSTVFEACSSGGLRIDAGLAEHVDCLFLSDPDWTEHHLGCLWGASQMLPPRQLLHWMQSEWRTDHRFQKVDYSGTLITLPQFDVKVQAAMLHRFGVSVRLPEMRTDLRDRLARHLVAYKQFVRPLLERGVLVPLNGQPLREERGNRSPNFQLLLGPRPSRRGIPTAPAATVGSRSPDRPRPGRALPGEIARSRRRRRRSGALDRRGDLDGRGCPAAGSRVHVDARPPAADPARLTAFSRVRIERTGLDRICPPGPGGRGAVAQSVRAGDS